MNQKFAERAGWVQLPDGTWWRSAFLPLQKSLPTLPCREDIAAVASTLNPLEAARFSFHMLGRLTYWTEFKPEDFHPLFGVAPTSVAQILAADCKSLYEALLFALDTNVESKRLSHTTPQHSHHHAT